MLRKLRDNLHWLPGYGAWRLQKAWREFRDPTPIRHVYVAVCDHFEPYWKNASPEVARRRLLRWIDEYPKIADKHRDSDGNVLKWSFFYPEDEYRKEDMDALAALCRAGYGDVEIHLHHDNDTSENLRRTLLDYKRRLHEDHGLLRRDPATGEIVYGFIHGNWALDNSRRDGRWCGVNDELTILQETGCYADFTLPSAPSETQTRKVNSIYWAVDDPARPKSHDTGKDVAVGDEGRGLLMVQGPLVPAWWNRKLGVLPGIENSGLQAGMPPSRERVGAWFDAGIGVRGAPGHAFVKLHTHGTQDHLLRTFFDEHWVADLLSCCLEEAAGRDTEVHFVTAWQMVERVHALRRPVAADTAAKAAA